MANSHMLTVFFFLSFSSFILTTTAENETKIVLRLIHRDSVLSPFHNHKVTNASNAISIDALSPFPSDDIRAPLSPEPNRLSFLVNISIGEPLVPQLLVMDTGSTLTWISTKCFPKLNPLFDPNHSSTYKNITCVDSYDCDSYIDYAGCRDDSRCIYRKDYAYHSISQGLLASEKFTFITSSGGIAEVSDIVFGVGLDTQGNAQMINGILGLEPLNNHSLISRVGNKFSYCIGNISDPYYMYNQLILGDGAIFEGSSTPMKLKDGHYVVKLEGIYVGQKQLSINQKEFDFNVVIDSGTTMSMLQRSGFDALTEEVMKLMEGMLELAEFGNSGDRPCYFGNLVRDLKGFPLVSLKFAGGAELDLDVEGLFMREDDYMFCMAIDISRNDFNIIGIYAQQHYNIGFDMDAMKLTFQCIECELLE